MANLVELEFPALDASGENYFMWASNVKRYLAAEGLKETLKEGNSTSLQDRAKAMVFIWRHLHEDLRFQYITVTEPLELMTCLENRYECLKQVMLPKARNDWILLSFQDFETVSEYNSAMFRIKAEMNICGKDIDHNEMLEKTLSTLHPLNMLLKQQYRERGFKTYYELIPCLLIAEHNNELVMKSHQSIPAGYVAFPEVNARSFDLKREREPLPKADASSCNNNKRGRGQQGRVAVIAKASGSSESSTSLNIVESVQNVWDKPEDRIALFGLGFASVVALWASLNLVTAIDKIPVVSGLFELIGIWFSAWFVYRYLLFKPDRKELVQIINKSLADVIGQ
ncbi:hypothetical protein Tco_0972517 [Tanacetum coccineum]